MTDRNCDRFYCMDQVPGLQHGPALGECEIVCVDIN